MSKRLAKERKRNYYYRKAKLEGYRSRAAYKLKQINRKYKLINKGEIVIDLGAAPGGWSQVAKELVGEKGTILAIDVKEIIPLETVKFIKGDITKKEILDNVLAIIQKADVVIADLSPSLSGNYSIDHARSVYLSEKALEFAEKVLKSHGKFVTKVFQGELFQDYLKKVNEKFAFVKAYAPEAKRKRSSEIYIIAKGFKG
jgi:23S rRNA (uridine2552-2'-O)-methyltransferase